MHNYQEQETINYVLARACSNCNQFEVKNLRCSHCGCKHEDHSEIPWTVAIPGNGKCGTDVSIRVDYSPKKYAMKKPPVKRKAKKKGK